MFCVASGYRVNSGAFGQVDFLVLCGGDLLVVGEPALNAESGFRNLTRTHFELGAEVCGDFELGDENVEEGLDVHNVLVRVLKTERVLSDFVV